MLSGPHASSVWHSRGYLPHFDAGQVAHFITFRLADSLPSAVLAEWLEELNQAPRHKVEELRREKIEQYLDRGIGPLWLAEPEVAEIVEQSLLHFDGSRLILHAWVIMPNHVHVLLTPEPGYSLPRILHSIKSFSAQRANEVLQRGGRFWQKEYYDRYIRNKIHFWDTVKYIQHNPVKAQLCCRADDWCYSSAARANHDYNFSQGWNESLEGIF